MLRPRVLALVAIVVAALVLRLRGLDYQLPHWTFHDGYPLFDQMRFVRGEDAWNEAEQKLGHYPYLTSATAAAMPDVTPSIQHGGDALSEACAEAAEPWIRIRLTVVLLSMLAVGATYGIARAFLGVGPSLLAAAFVATSLMHVTFSAAQRPHGAASGTAALAVLSALYLRRACTWRRHLLCACAVALSVATLQTCLPTLFSWAAAWWLAARPEPRPSRMRGAAQWVAGLAIVALAVRLAYPFHFGDVPSPSVQAGDAEGAIKLASHTIHLTRFNGRGFPVLVSAFVNFDPLLTLALVAGLALLVVRALRGRSSFDRERLRDAGVCLAFAAPLFLFVSIYEMTWARFFLPLIPFAAMLAAWILGEAWRALSQGRFGERAALVAAALVLAFPTSVAWRLGTLRARDDTFELASRWIAEHAEPERSRIVLLQSSFDLPLFYAATSLQGQRPVPVLYWKRAQMRRAPGDFGGPRFGIEHLAGEFEPGEQPLQSLRELGYDFAVTMQSGFRRELRTLATALREARRAGRTAVYDPASDAPAKAERLPEMGFGVLEAATAWSILGSERLGPRLEIVRL